MKHYSELELIRIFNMSVSATETMNNLEVEPDVIKARLKLLRELADGFGIDVSIPSNKAVMIKRFLGGER